MDIAYHIFGLLVAEAELRSALRLSVVCAEMRRWCLQRPLAIIYTLNFMEPFHTFMEEESEDDVQIKLRWKGKKWRGRQTGQDWIVPIRHYGPYGHRPFELPLRGVFRHGPGRDPIRRLNRRQINPYRSVRVQILRALLQQEVVAHKVDLVVLVYCGWGLHRLSMPLPVSHLNTWMRVTAAECIANIIAERNERKVVTTRLEITAMDPAVEVSFIFHLQMGFADDDSVTWDGDYGGDLLLRDIGVDRISLDIPFDRMTTTMW